MIIPTKPCIICGRTIEWRRKWKDDWEAVKYCSKGCRSLKLGPVDEALETAILDGLDKRARGVTICPSEVACQVRPDDWRDWMERVRMAARRLVAAEQIEILQRGRVVDGSKAKGPIRLRRILRS